MLLEAASLKSFAHSLIYEYLGKTGVKLADFCGDIIGALLILFIGFKIVSYVVKMAHKIFERSIMDTTLQTFLLSFIKIGGKVLVIFMAVTKIGVAASSIVALLGSAGLALGLSLQGSLSNIAGGVILLLLKPFQVGDYIIEGNSGKEGTVQAIGIMYTKLLSVDNKAIMIPNGNLSNASITNVTYQEKRRVDLNVGIEYSEDIKKQNEENDDISDQKKRSGPPRLGAVARAADYDSARGLGPVELHAFRYADGREPLDRVPFREREGTALLVRL